MNERKVYCVNTSRCIYYTEFSVYLQMDVALPHIRSIQTIYRVNSSTQQFIYSTALLTVELFRERFWIQMNKKFKINFYQSIDQYEL